MLADDAPDDRGPVAVVLGVVGRVDGGVRVRVGLGEGDIPLESAGADAADAAGLRADEPGVARPVGRADVQVVTGPYYPDGDVRAEAAVRPCGGDLQLLRLSYPRQVVLRPCCRNGGFFLPTCQGVGSRER